MGKYSFKCYRVSNVGSNFLNARANMAVADMLWVETSPGVGIVSVMAITFCHVRSRPLLSLLAGLKKKKKAKPVIVHSSSFIVLSHYGRPAKFSSDDVKCVI